MLAEAVSFLFIVVIGFVLIASAIGFALMAAGAGGAAMRLLLAAEPSDERDDAAPADTVRRD